MIFHGQVGLAMINQCDMKSQLYRHTVVPYG